MEYLPPNFHDPSTWPFLIFIGLLIAAFGLRSKRLESGQVFLAAAWLVMGLYSVRNVPLFAIAAAPVLAASLHDWLHASQHQAKGLAKFYNLDQRLLTIDLSLRGPVWPLICLALAIAGFRAGVPLDFAQRGNAFDPQVFPVQAADWLAQNPQSGKMFNYFPWGGYMLYRFWPGSEVFIDGQTDFYGEQFTRQYEQVISLSPGWQEVLDRYQVDWAILPPGEALSKQLREDPGWKPAYADQTAVVFVRKTE
jgi:hypothetical protein